MATAQPSENGSAKAPDPDLKPTAPEFVTDAATTSAPDSDPTTTDSDQNQNPDSESAPKSESEAPATTSSSDAISAADKRWPGWPGDCVFRLIVPVLKVGSIIGRKGELIKKMCEETRARIRVLEGAAGTTDRIVSCASFSLYLGFALL